MAYATATDMRARYDEAELIDLTDQSNLGIADEDRLDQALTDASDLIDRYLAGRYSLPLTAAPNVLEQLACRIARYLLYRHPPEEVEKRYEEDIHYLEQVAAGKFGIGVTDSGAAAAPADGARMSSGGRVFGRTDSDGNSKDGFI